MSTLWKALKLPPDYRLELGPDVLVLRRADNSAVATFSASGVVPECVEVAAWENTRRSVDKVLEELESPRWE